MNKLLLTKNKYKYRYKTNGSFKRQENYRPIKKHKERKKSFGLKACGYGSIIFIIGLFIIFYIYQFAQIAELNYQINKLEKTLKTVNTTNQNLRLEIAQRKSLQEVEEKAISLYNMVEPEKVYYVSLGGEETFESNSVDRNTGEKNNIGSIVLEVAHWFKNLTSVEAGTLDE